MVRSCSYLAQPPSWRTTPFLSVRDCLFNTFPATLHIGCRSSIRNLTTCHAVVTGTELSWLFCILWWIYYNRWFITCIVSMYNKQYCFLSSWYVSFLGSSGKVTYNAWHLELQIVCFKSITIVCSVKKICIILVSKYMAYSSSSSSKKSVFCKLDMMRLFVLCVDKRFALRVYNLCLSCYNKLLYFCWKLSNHYFHIQIRYCTLKNFSGVVFCE